MNTYQIEVDRIEPNGDIFRITEQRTLKATKSFRGRDRQLKNLVDRVEAELKYYQVPYKRFAVSVV